MSAASERVQSTNDEQEVPAPASEPSRPTEPRHPLPVPPTRDAVLPFEEGDDFDFHDTIPAPPWHDDELETAEVPPVPTR